MTSKFKFRRFNLIQLNMIHATTTGTTVSSILFLSRDGFRRGSARRPSRLSSVPEIPPTIHTGSGPARAEGQLGDDAGLEALDARQPRSALRLLRGRRRQSEPGSTPRNRRRRCCGRHPNSPELAGWRVSDTLFQIEHSFRGSTLCYIRLSLERAIFLTVCGVVTASLASLVLGIIMLLVIAGKSTYTAVHVYP